MKYKPATHDIQLMTRAIKERWPVPEGARKRCVKEAVKILGSSDNSKLKVLASKFLLEVDKHNLAVTQHFDKEDRLDAGKPTAIYEKLDHPELVELADSVMSRFASLKQPKAITNEKEEKEKSDGEVVDDGGSVAGDETEPGDGGGA